MLCSSGAKASLALVVQHQNHQLHQLAASNTNCQPVAHVYDQSNQIFNIVQGRCSTSSATGLKLVPIQCVIYIDMIGKIHVLNQIRRRCSVKIETKHSFFLAIGDLPVATMVYQFQTSIDGTLNNIFKVVPEVKGDKDVVSQPCALPCHVCSF